MSTDIEDIHSTNNVTKATPLETRQQIFLQYMLNQTFADAQAFNKCYNKAVRKFYLGMGKTELFNLYKLSNLPRNKDFERYCVKLSSRSHSGVCVISTIMAPEFTFRENNRETKQKFTCKYDCFFCPNDPEQARSYPRQEPVPMRGSQNDFDVIRQSHSRMSSLSQNNHVIDKLEWLVLGGTWSSYPKEYREQYHAEIFFSANLWSEGVNACEVFHQYGKDWRNHVRPIGTIQQEMDLNRKSNCRVIGVTIETRPDQITLQELRFMRNLGITRIQMGFQHTDNEILRKVNRGCTIETCKEGLRLAMINGFKVDAHWMPDLPGATPQIDRDMITKIFTDPALRCDQIKLYPCQVLDFTKIKQWYDEGKYKPYAETDFDALIDLLVYAKTIIPPSVRTNRIVRDFPKHIIRGGLNTPHLCDVILSELKKRGQMCMCIRCREVKRQNVDYNMAQIVVRQFDACDGREYFISMEIVEDNILLGFCRLRINPKTLDLNEQFPELHGCALIRELHVYGQTTAVTNRDEKHVQHRGFGQQLMERAEQIARESGCERVAVIAGVGVQNYYSKLGYQDGFYMVKDLGNYKVEKSVNNTSSDLWLFIMILVIMIAEILYRI